MYKLKDNEQQSPLERMIQQQVVERGIRDERVLDALRSVPRERFFPQENRAEAFADRAGPIGHGQTISQPYMVALMTHRLELRPEHKVLELGTGSGYQPAAPAGPRQRPPDGRPRAARGTGLQRRAGEAAAGRGLRTADVAGDPQRPLPPR